MTKRILVIEDDDAVRSMILDALKTRQWRGIPAVDGLEGVRAAQTARPDLILCDIQMPHLDGYGVLGALRANPATATIPLVFLTGLSDKPQMRQAMEGGADDYLVKPFTIQELLAAVEARFQKQAAIDKSTDAKLDGLREQISFALPHELVTPLNAILGFSSLLLEPVAFSRDQLQEYAKHIHGAGERLRELVEKFLAYAQVELLASNPEQRREVTAIAPGPTAESISIAAIRAARDQQREPDLTLEVTPADYPISGPHLERMVREVAVNAFKFSPPGSGVRVRSSPRDGGLCIEITDHGHGLSEEQIRRIGANVQFDRKLREQQGSGLGLAIARRLAEIYEGKLEIESVPDEQTTVTILLPRPEAAAP